MWVTRLKSNFLKSYYFRFIFNVLISAIVFLLVSFFLFYNIYLYNYSNSDLYITSNNSVFNNIYLVLLCIGIGIISFVITFVLLDRRRNMYIEDIYTCIDRISKGDFSTKIKIESTDDISIIALNINRMQDKIIELMNNERENEKSKNELITNIAHDLRTPLTSIIGYLELLVNNKTINEDEKNKFLKIAYDKSLKLEELIEDLFSLTKMNYGKLSLKPEKFDLVKLLDQLITELYPLFERNSLSYEFKTNVKSLTINADPKLLARLFENLINNAIKYCKDSKEISIKLKYDNDIKGVYVSVVNYGKVIPKNSLNKIFDKFYRVDNSRTSETGGTGLGLAIAKSIVELHSGVINVKSDINGTEFEVYLDVDIKDNKK